MTTRFTPFALILIFFAASLTSSAAETEDLKRLAYNNPQLSVDLGVGLWAWPMPVDYDNDGDLDLLVSCPDKPYNGVYFFENPGGDAKMPIFKPGKKISSGQRNISISMVDGKPRYLIPGKEVQLSGNDIGKTTPIYSKTNLLAGKKIRANQWQYVDYDGSGNLSLVAAIGEWTDYGWDDAYNDQGQWTNGPLHGWIYLIRPKDKPTGDAFEDRYHEPELLQAGGKPIDVFGRPSPNFADFDNDGDLDLLCGEFLDGFTYFQNVGTRSQPKYAAGKRLTYQGKPLVMDLEMIVPSAVDWDHDGDIDLIVGDEDGRVAFIEHTGKVTDGMPEFLPPRYFQQQAADIKFGALATPCGYDWDGDGDDDIICGNTAGYISFIENLSSPGDSSPRWAAPQLLKAAGQVIRIQAGPNGSIQGPCEAKWGYTTQTVGDWDNDGLPDLILNSIWGKILWYKNIGTRKKPKLAAAQAVQVAWPSTPPKPKWNWWNPEGNNLVTQWRTTPVLTDWNQDGLTDLIMLDHEGYLCLWERKKTGQQTVLLPPQRIFTDRFGKPLRLNSGYAGKSGRYKLSVVDWDGDEDLDLLVNSSNADFYENVKQQNGQVVLENRGPLGQRKVAGHTSSPTTVDFNNNGIPDLLIGAEDGFLYYMENPRTK